MRQILLILATAGCLGGQVPTQFSLLSIGYLQFTAAQGSSIDANNAAYLQAQTSAGLRLQELLRQVSAEIQKAEPDAGVIGAAYAEQETICRNRQSALNEVIQKNVAVLTSAQRTRLDALQYFWLRERLSERAKLMGLAQVPATTSQGAPILPSGTEFELVSVQRTPGPTGPWSCSSTSSCHLSSRTRC